MGVVEVWNLETGRKLRELKGQTATVTGIDVSADGEFIVACSDRTIRLWDVAGQFLATVAQGPVPARRVRFLPDGHHVAIAYDDGAIEVRSLDYFFRYAAGQADYQLRVLNKLGESFPRAGEARSWSRGILSRP